MAKRMTINWLARRTPPPSGCPEHGGTGAALLVAVVGIADGAQAESDGTTVSGRENKS